MIRKRRDRIALYLGIFLGSIQWSHADLTPPTVSTTKELSFFDKVNEKFALRYFGMYNGASFANLSSSVQPQVSGEPDPSSPQNIDSIVTVGYKLDKTSILGVWGHFYYFPVGNPAGSGQSVQLLDPSLLLSKSDLYESNGLRIGGRLTVNLPLSKADALVPNQLVTSVTPTVMINYDVPKTGLTLGLFAYVRGYIGPDAIPGAPTYKIYVAPNVNYQITKTLAATLWVDLVQARRVQGTGFISGLRNDVVDIEPGINWDITSNISINPVINIYPANPTLASTSLKAFIVARAF